MALALIYIRFCFQWVSPNRTVGREVCGSRAIEMGLNTLSHFEASFNFRMWVKPDVLYLVRTLRFCSICAPEISFLS